MTRLLLTGSHGFIGRHYLQHLQQRSDFAVVTGVRGDPAVGDRDQPAQLNWQASAQTLVDDLRAAEIDVVVHLAGLAHGGVQGADASMLLETNARASLDLFRAAAQAGVRRFVWLSSIKVLGEVAAAPLLPDAPYQPADAYARSKTEGERLLLAAAAAPDAPALAILRPPLVYGPEVGANYLQLLRWANAGVPLPLAGATAARSMVGITNLLSLLDVLAQRGSGVFHVADPTDWSVRDLLTEMARLCGTRARLFNVPGALLRTAAGLVGQRARLDRLLNPLRVDVVQTCMALDWSPPATAIDQLEETVSWFLQRP